MSARSRPQCPRHVRPMAGTLHPLSSVALGPPREEFHLYIAKRDGDDAEYVGFLNHFLSLVVERFEPPEVRLIRIDNWFDHKWLGFAGNKRISVDTTLPGDFFDIRSFWGRGANVPIPPFSPNRVLEEDCFVLDQGRANRVDGPEDPVHSADKRRSEDNIGNKVLDRWSDILLVWFASMTEKNQRGSMLWYRAKEGRLRGWYVEFLRKDRWQVGSTKNIDRGVVSSIFDGFYSN